MSGSGTIIINRVTGQLAVIDNPANSIYSNLTPVQADAVEMVRVKGPSNWTANDWATLLLVCATVG